MSTPTPTARQPRPRIISARDLDAGQTIADVLDQVSEVILGKRRQASLALSCLLAGGHLLIEDIPGVGKTTLAQVFARVLGLKFSRIQFTSDLLPADVVGVAIYHAETATFRFQPGPLFAEVVLADELNRATPKAQSALLEAMEEHQATVDGKSHQLPQPFFVIATQNPMNQIGTFPLPESQLDRFMMRIEIGYPDRATERKLLTRKDPRTILPGMTPVMNARQVGRLQKVAAAVHTGEALVDYAQALLDASRRSAWLSHGLSSRAGMALVRSARAWALINGRDHVVPEDLQQVAAAVLEHRLQAADREASTGGLAERLIRETAIP
ncbi:MAG TPA: AAA family ATPase [Gammaproteobacteria bacterium]|jgi:MoxR-like ATPase|nr:AAA family ATPase [Arenicellales bacterium]HCY13943.1 AAA family ATPase [Gammaproteobacteria bacterium]|tara:strand:+ start:292 stop:1269 length:978 start_codon:yes stop_codon:yes gene_type:complete